MIEAEPPLASSAGTEPADAATAEEAGRVTKAPVAHDSLSRQSAQAASAAAGTDAGNTSGKRAEATRPSRVPAEPGAHASASSAGDAPRVGVNCIRSGRSLEGLSSAGESTGRLDADSRRALAAFKAARERSTAHGAPADKIVWGATDGSGGQAQSSSAESPPTMPCSATAAGTAAAVDGVSQLPTHEAGRQPAETGSAQGEASSSAHAARVGKHQAAHNGQDQQVNHIRRCGPPRSAAVTGDFLKCGKRRESSEGSKDSEGSEGAATVSGGSVESSQAASGEPLTLQQQAVVAALMVVMKRAKLEGHEAFASARERLLCNDWHTQAVLQYVRAGQELHSISNMEQMLQIRDQEDRDVLDALATQYSAAGLQPLQVFTRSVQCGVMPACRAAESRGEAAVLARHQQVAELHRQLDKHRLTATWMRSNVDLLVRQGVDEIMAELIMLALVLLAELCKRSSWPSDIRRNGHTDYIALDHLLPGK